jgi:hypothetical protein
MDRGETLAQILSAYPGLEQQIEPLVLVAMLGRALPPPVPGHTALRLGKNNLLSEMALMEAQGAFLDPVPKKPPTRPVLERWGESTRQLQSAFRFTALSMVVVLAGGFYTLSASASELSDQVIQSLFFNFEGVGDLLRINPEAPGVVGDGVFLKGVYQLPGDPGGDFGGFKAPPIDHGNQDQHQNQEQSRSGGNGKHGEDSNGNQGEGNNGNQGEGNNGNQGDGNNGDQGEGNNGNQGEGNNGNQGNGDNGNHYGQEKQEEDKDNGNNKDKDKEKKDNKNKDGKKDK